VIDLAVVILWRLMARSQKQVWQVSLVRGQVCVCMFQGAETSEVVFALIIVSRLMAIHVMLLVCMCVPAQKLLHIRCFSTFITQLLVRMR